MSDIDGSWFCGVVGYHTSLLFLWSPVRARAKSLMSFFACHNTLFSPSLIHNAIDLINSNQWLLD